MGVLLRLAYEADRLVDHDFATLPGHFRLPPFLEHWIELEKVVMGQPFIETESPGFVGELALTGPKCHFRNAVR